MQQKKKGKQKQGVTFFREESRKGLSCFLLEINYHFLEYKHK